MNKGDYTAATFLIIYLAITGIYSVSELVSIFPEITDDDNVKFPGCLSTEQGMILLSLLAGAIGSFIHTSQSLITYIGNREFKYSWTAWYFMRPLVGAVLGLAVYFVFRGGLIAGASVFNPYGLVAIGLMAGWFSETTTDKLEEVFKTLFKTDADKKRGDKLGDSRPVIEGIQPDPAPADTTELLIKGRNFLEGAKVFLNGTALETEYVSTQALKAKVTPPLATDTQAKIKIENPDGYDPTSRIYELEIK